MQIADFELERYFARHEFRTHPAAVRNAIRQNTRVVVINYPQSPTGAELRRDEFDAIVDACAATGVTLIALRARDRVLARARGIIAANLALLDEFFERHRTRVEWVRPPPGVLPSRGSLLATRTASRRHWSSARGCYCSPDRASDT
jgi:hypothetical protein